MATSNLPIGIAQMGIELSLLRVKVDAIEAALAKIGVATAPSSGSDLALASRRVYRAPLIPLAEAESRRNAAAATAELTRHPSDFVTGKLKGGDPERTALHNKAIALMRKVEASGAGRKLSYADAVRAVTERVTK